MKRRARERLPRREPGSFPSFLYMSLDALEGTGPEDEFHPLDQATRAKPLLILTDVELDEALLHRIGLPWICVLTLQRLRADPLREGIVGAPGDLLRNALKLGRLRWRELAADLESIAAPLLPTLPADADHAPLHEAWARYQQSEG